MGKLQQARMRRDLTRRCMRHASQAALFVGTPSGVILLLVCLLGAPAWLLAFGAALGFFSTLGVAVLAYKITRWAGEDDPDYIAAAHLGDEPSR